MRTGATQAQAYCGQTFRPPSCLALRGAGNHEPTRYDCLTEGRLPWRCACLKLGYLYINIVNTSFPCCFSCCQVSVYFILTLIFVFFKITFANKIGKFDLEVTTFQMAVLFAWNERPHEKIAFENLRSVQGILFLYFVKQEKAHCLFSRVSCCRLASELPDSELRRTLWVCELIKNLHAAIIIS